ncbi:hypothetical protein [Nitrosopumilus sp.]|uniref:hypothetical protein n=1 Tax=Nitrosopumilus sp. TaxID=2024843 RepID=UPI00262F6E94|nr:hypothetical protein [Nitrosopumilus sp.]
MVAVYTFLIPWIFVWIRKNHQIQKKNSYEIVVYDTEGQIIFLDDLRTKFQNNDVAWSFMKEYKVLYPFYDFGLVSIDNVVDETTMIKYL